MKADPRQNSRYANADNSMMSATLQQMANVRVSTGGSSKLDTIKAFVEQANRNQMEQLQAETACSIEQAEFMQKGFRKPL